jgi:hypothetical protein
VGLLTYAGLLLAIFTYDFDIGLMVAIVGTAIVGWAVILYCVGFLIVPSLASLIWIPPAVRYVAQSLLVKKLILSSGSPRWFTRINNQIFAVMNMESVRLFDEHEVKKLKPSA